MLKLVSMIFRRRVSKLKLLLPVALLVCLAGSASAQSDTEVERVELTRQLQEARLRVRQLEEKLRLLESGRAPSAGVPKQLQANAAAPAEPECGNPFILDQDGVKHVRPECVATSSAVSCETSPFVLDDEGIKHLRLDCGY
jgi:cell division protein FtsB